MAGLFSQQNNGMQGGFMTPEMQKQLQQQQIMGMAQGLLNASGPSRTPVSFGQALGQGMQGAQQSGQQEQERMMNQLLLQMKLKEAQRGQLPKGYTFNEQTGKAERIAGLPEGFMGDDMPSNIQEYQYYNKLSPAEQKRYLEVKRQQQWLNTGPGFTNPATGGVIPKGLAPEDLPQTKEDQARAGKRGEAKGAAEGAIEKKYINAPTVEGYLKEAEALLPKATSGGAETMGRDIAGWFGNATAGSETDSQLDVLGAALTAGVPRMEGPQSNYDVKLYEKAAGDLANASLPRERRLAAIKTIRQINNKYMNQNTDVAPSQNEDWLTTITKKPPAAPSGGGIKFLGFE